MAVAKQTDTIWMNFSGTEEDIQLRLLSIEKFWYALPNCLAIKIFRPDIPMDFVDCLELHVYFKFEEDYMGMRRFSQMKQETRTFITKLVLYIANIYRKLGRTALPPFKEIIKSYSCEELLDIVARGISAEPGRTSELQLATALIREHGLPADLPSEEGQMLAHLATLVYGGLNLSCPSHMITDLGYIAVKTQFCGFSKEQISSLYDKFIVEACCPFHGEPVGVDKLVEFCNESTVETQKFINSTFSFVSSSMEKMDLDVFSADKCDVTLLVATALPKILQSTSTTAERAVSYILSITLLQLPIISEDCVFVGIIGSDETSRIHNPSPICEIRQPLQDLGLIINNYDIFDKKFSSLPIHRDDHQIKTWYALSLLMAGEYNKFLSWYEQCEYANQNCRFLIFAAFSRSMIKDQSAIKDVVKVLQLIFDDDDDCNTANTLLVLPTDLVAADCQLHITSKKHLACPSTMEWLFFTVAECANLNLIEFNIIFSQVNFDTTGIVALEFAMEKLKETNIRNLDSLVNYVKHEQVALWLNTFLLQNSTEDVPPTFFTHHPLSNADALHLLKAWFESCIA